jgi:hypothetical protein
MAKKSKSKGKSGGRMLPVLHEDAAGIDIGAEEIFVAVPSDRVLDPVQSFGTFTRDLHEEFCRENLGSPVGIRTSDPLYSCCKHRCARVRISTVVGPGHCGN